MTLLIERDATGMGIDPNDVPFEIEEIEQVKGLPKGRAKPGMMDYFDRLKIPVIENTAQ